MKSDSDGKPKSDGIHLSDSAQGLNSSVKNKNHNQNDNMFGSILSHLNFNKFATISNFTQPFCGRKDENIMDWLARFTRVSK